MKRYSGFLICLLLSSAMLAVISCKKHHTAPKVPSPTWRVDGTGKYPESMTAVIQVSGSLQAHVTKTDKLGAFIDGECRGLGTLVTTDTATVFFMLIRGAASEQSEISFKYYSTWKSYIYETDDVMDFSVDANYGTVDSPEVLILKK